MAIKKKKPTVKSVTEELATAREINTYLRRDLNSAQLAVHDLNKRLEAKVDTSMMEARTKLASQLGQMMEAFSKAIGFIVAKEVL